MDLKELFELALADDGGPHADVPPDPAADLRRGRKLLARRRRHRAFGAAAATAVTAAVAAGVVTTVAGGPAPKSPLAATSAPATKGAPATAAIRLVAYTGTQPSGYTVRVIPAGWVIQGSNPFALVIAPADARSKDPDDFMGKLVVTQESFDTNGAGGAGWSPVPVAGHTAYYAAEIGGTPVAGLVIDEAPGRWLLVQAPASLSWTKQQMVRFGLGVTVLKTAKEGKG